MIIDTVVKEKILFILGKTMVICGIVILIITSALGQHVAAKGSTNTGIPFILDTAPPSLLLSCEPNQILIYAPLNKGEWGMVWCRVRPTWHHHLKHHVIDSKCTTFGLLSDCTKPAKIIAHKIEHGTIYYGMNKSNTTQSQPNIW